MVAATPPGRLACCAEQTACPEPTSKNRRRALARRHPGRTESTSPDAGPCPAFCSNVVGYREVRRMVHSISGTQWAKAGLVAMVVAAWPTYALLTERRAPEIDPSAEVAKLDYTLKDMNGKEVRLSDFKGRPLVINFWATWCAPCKHEIPSFVALVGQVQGQEPDGPRHLDGRRAGGPPEVRGRVQDQLSGPRRPRHGRAARGV